MNKYYYPVMDYNGWCVFQSDNLKDINHWMDYPFVSTSYDSTARLVEVLRARQKNICVIKGNTIIQL